MRINVNTVSEKGLFSKDTVIHKSVHDPFAVVLQAVVQIFDTFRHMNVISHLIRLVLSRQFHRLIRDRELRVHAHHTGDHAAVIL